VVAHGGLEIDHVDDHAVDGAEHAANIARLFRYSLSPRASRLRARRSAGDAPAA
jgi:hypothetical protein